MRQNSEMLKVFFFGKKILIKIENLEVQNLNIILWIYIKSYHFI
jgi:hypothetical protein